MGAWVGTSFGKTDLEALLVLHEDSNLAHMCLRWAPRATRIAYLITADEAGARRIGRRTVVRCAARASTATAHEGTGAS